jgi:hypothetical protein
MVAYALPLCALQYYYKMDVVMKQLQQILARVESKIVLLCLGAALGGIILFGLIRFVFVPDTTVHYHANFAVFINGQREQFKGDQYYQEISACSATDRPQSRAHMHDHVNHVIHVHAPLVTWANFFSVLGWSLQDTSLFDGKQAYVDGSGGRLHFILNGKPALSVANEVIKTEDRLLISFGNEDAPALNGQFNQVESDAKYYNEHKDPASCAGPEAPTVWQRLERAFWF